VSCAPGQYQGTHHCNSDGDNPFPVTSETGLLPHLTADGDGRDLFPALVQDGNAPFHRARWRVGSDLSRDDLGLCLGIFIVSAIKAVAVTKQGSGPLAFCASAINSYDAKSTVEVQKAI
jgi:hypothetical protein